MNLLIRICCIVPTVGNWACGFCLYALHMSLLIVYFSFTYCNPSLLGIVRGHYRKRWFRLKVCLAEYLRNIGFYCYLFPSFVWLLRKGGREKEKEKTFSILLLVV